MGLAIALDGLVIGCFESAVDHAEVGQGHRRLVRQNVGFQVGQKIGRGPGPPTELRKLNARGRLTCGQAVDDIDDESQLAHRPIAAEGDAIAGFEQRLGRGGGDQ